MTRDAYYKWFKRCNSTYRKQQDQLYSAILELEKEHNFTLGYLGMTTQLKAEGKLDWLV